MTFSEFKDSFMIALKYINMGDDLIEKLIVILEQMNNSRGKQRLMH